jgi:hypothetical protein
MRRIEWVECAEPHKDHPTTRLNAYMRQLHGMKAVRLTLGDPSESLKENKIRNQVILRVTRKSAAVVVAVSRL